MSSKCLHRYSSACGRYFVRFVLWLAMTEIVEQRLCKEYALNKGIYNSNLIIVGRCRSCASCASSPAAAASTAPLTRSTPALAVPKRSAYSGSIDKSAISVHADCPPHGWKGYSYDLWNIALMFMLGSEQRTLQISCRNASVLILRYAPFCFILAIFWVLDHAWWTFFNPHLSIIPNSIINVYVFAPYLPLAHASKLHPNNLCLQTDE